MVEDFQDAKNDVIALVFKGRQVSRKWHSYGSKGVKGMQYTSKWCYALVRIGVWRDLVSCQYYIS